ncbi:MAG: molecular chaperone TorD family protein [Azospirillum sp.]|jgi:TorA maturation chaperone TorD|nr:molecular chaperone TorD family protein [Azospirillum sp.]
MNADASLQALERAVELAGGQSALARAIGKSQSHIWHWLKVAKRVPAEAAVAIEKATGVPRRELRPDLYAQSDDMTSPKMENEQSAAEIADEDMLRAQLYALLGELLADIPTAQTLARVGELSGDPATELGESVNALAAVARKTTAQQASDEYHDLFIGVAAGELQPYASVYLTGFLHEKPLADLRGTMGELGIARAAKRAEPEDHIASLCEMMAGLIVGGFGAPADLKTQREFFDRHLAPWAGRFFEDLAAAKAARLYMPVGRIGKLFLEIEREAFAMDA